MSNKPVRVRFAPSPTGPLHIGGVRTALYNYLFAKKYNGTFILRIEDTDQTRFVEGAEEYLVKSLKWCGIMPTEGEGIGGNHGPYKQSNRKEIYKSYVDKLVATGKAYYAFDTAEELNLKREEAQNSGEHSWQYNANTRMAMKNSFTLSEEEVQQRIESGDQYVIRFTMPENEDVHFVDIIRGEVTINSHNLDDKVLYKSDGLPTYHMANIIDDHLMEISHVIRGEEWLPSTPLHVLLYKAFGWEAPQFAHLPLLLRPDGKGKLSKRDGDRLGFPVFPMDWHAEDGEIFSGYKERGYFPNAFINMLALLGWNPGTTQEIFTLDEMVDAFSLDRVHKAGAKFDADKTNWFQQQYLKETNDIVLGGLLRESLSEELKDFDDTYLSTASGLMKERITFVDEIYHNGKYLFENPTDLDEKTIKKRWKDDTEPLVVAWTNVLESITDFSADNLENEFKSFVEKQEIGIGKILLPFRLVITGTGGGPDIFKVVELIRKEETLKRMKDNLSKIKEIIG